MAKFVIAVPGMTPAAYWELSQDETAAVIDELNEQAKARKRR